MVILQRDCVLFCSPTLGDLQVIEVEKIVWHCTMDWRTEQAWYSCCSRCRRTRDARLPEGPIVRRASRPEKVLVQGRVRWSRALMTKGTIGDDADTEGQIISSIRNPDCSSRTSPKTYRGDQIGRSIFSIPGLLYFNFLGRWPSKIGRAGGGQNCDLDYQENFDHCISAT